MKTAYSYIRFSTPEQAKGNSFTRQSTAKEWCNANGYILSDQTFLDAGKSGFKGDNLKEGGELKKFLELVENGTISRGSVLIVENYDRLSRLPPVESTTLFLNLIIAGIGIVFTTSYDKRIIDYERTNKEQGCLSRVIGEVERAHNESKRKSEMIIASKQAKKIKMQSGEIVAHNNIPKYFTYVPETETNGHYIHNKNTDIVRELIEGILAGKSLYSMADDLNERKVKTFRRGFQWSGNSISKILRNRVLVGEYLGNANYLPKIIDETEFQKVQNVLKGNSYNSGATGEIVNIFRGICFCSDPNCEKSMQVAAQFKKNGVKLEKPYRYLRCSVMGKHAACKNRKHIKLEAMERAFFWHFLGKTPYEVINGDDKAELKELNKTKIENESKLNKLTSDITTTLDMIGIVSGDEVKAKLAKLNQQRDTVKAELDNLNAKIGLIQYAPENLRAVLGTTTKFGEGENGEDIVTPIFDYPAEKLDEALQDNAAREKTRIMLPSLISKITVDTNEGRFYVYNRVGKMIFKSVRIVSSRNNSEVWKNSLKTWTKRKTAGGKVIVCKRKNANK